MNMNNLQNYFRRILDYVEDLNNLVGKINSKLLINDSYENNDFDILAHYFLQFLVKYDVYQEIIFNDLVVGYECVNFYNHECYTNRNFGYIDYEYFILNIINDIFNKKTNFDYDLYTNESINNIISLIDVIFPVGKHGEKKTYLKQIDDYKINYNEIKSMFYPTLNNFREYRQSCFGELIKVLANNNYLKETLDLFKKYSFDYNIPFRYLIVNLRTINFKKLDRNNLIYLFELCENEKNNNEKEINSFRKYMISFIECSPEDKFKFRLDELKCSNDYNEIYKILIDDYTLVKKIDDTINLRSDYNSKARYFLSILIREYYDFENSYQMSVYHTFINQVIDEINLEMNDKIEKFEFSIFPPKDLSKDEKIKCLLNYFKDGLKKIKSYHLNNTKSDIIYDKLFSKCNNDLIISQCIDKIINNEILVNQIVGGEYLFDGINKNKKSKNLPIDFTYLVASQIKAVERFLKECILNHLAGVKAELIKRNISFIPGCKHLNKLDPNSKNKDEKTFVHSQLGGINSFLEQCFKNSVNHDKIFSSNNQYTIFGKDFNENFIQVIRNGHFHTSVINSFEDAEKYRVECAFWLVCCIYELKEIY